MSSAAATRPAATAEAPRTDAAQLGMWIFLAGEMLFFGALAVVYFVARRHAPDGFAAASGRTDLWLGTLNTAVLLSSSFAVALAAEASTRKPAKAARWLWLAVALGLTFLLVKGIEYRDEWREQLFPGPAFALASIGGAELFFTWYFVVTGLHALHLAIGIGLCAGFARALQRGGLRGDAGATRVHVAALYWHFVDVVWIVWYPLIYLVAPRR
jgi:cytochrome c oxidase subunit 3